MHQTGIAPPPADLFAAPASLDRLRIEGSNTKIARVYAYDRDSGGVLALTRDAAGRYDLATLNDSDLRAERDDGTYLELGGVLTLLALDTLDEGQPIFRNRPVR